MLIGATIAGREKVEVNPTTKLSRAIQGDKGILLNETNYACPESWLRASVTRFAQMETCLYFLVADAVCSYTKSRQSAMLLIVQLLNSAFGHWRLCFLLDS